MGERRSSIITFVVAIIVVLALLVAALISLVPTLSDYPSDRWSAVGGLTVGGLEIVLIAAAIRYPRGVVVFSSLAGVTLLAWIFAFAASFPKDRPAHPRTHLGTASLGFGVVFALAVLGYLVKAMVAEPK